MAARWIRLNISPKHKWAEDGPLWGKGCSQWNGAPFSSCVSLQGWRVPLLAFHETSSRLLFAYCALAFLILFVTVCYSEETIVFHVRLVTKSRRALYFFRQTRFIGDRMIHRRCCEKGDDLNGASPSETVSARVFMGCGISCVSSRRGVERRWKRIIGMGCVCQTAGPNV